MFWLILIITVVVFVVLLWNMKIPKCGNMVLITGGVKTGKSMLSVHMVVRTYKKNLIKYYIQKALVKVHIIKARKVEKPLIYSNIPIKTKYGYVPLTLQLLKRETRFNYGSVIYICESSLVADSMYYKDEYINEQMLLLYKLIAHETKGGTIFLDTQSVQDNHFAVRRCISNYFWIHHTVKLPLFLPCLLYVREMMYSENANVQNNFNEDVEVTLKRVIVPKKVWKMYDRYCYSAFTDNLEVENRVKKVNKKRPDLKARSIITFKKYKNLYGGVINEKNDK